MGLQSECDKQPSHIILVIISQGVERGENIIYRVDSCIPKLSSSEQES